MRKECIRFGLSRRFTMKEALVELAITLVRNNLDPRTYQFFPSQPLQGHFPYQVEILTDLVETMKASGTCTPPTTSKQSGINASQGLDNQNQVLKKLLTSVEMIQEVLEKTMHSAGYGE